MAKCLECGQVYCVYGGSKGSKCPTCESQNIDASMECRIKANEIEE